jgi:hypothetical protein
VSNLVGTMPVKKGIFVPNLQGRPIPVISMYVEEYGPWILPENFEWHPVLLSVWSNGDIIYSHDYVRGGRPYYSAKVSEQQVESFLSSLTASELWGKFPKGYFKTGPDSSFTNLIVIYHNQIMELGSWHELFEARGKSVGTAHGIESLEGRTIQKVLAEQPQEYRDFRQLWDMIRSGAKALIPKEGIETDPNWIEDRWSRVGNPDSGK